jgi:hypothetical protein
MGARMGIILIVCHQFGEGGGIRLVVCKCGEGRVTRGVRGCEGRGLDYDKEGVLGGASAFVRCFCSVYGM